VRQAKSIEHAKCTEKSAGLGAFLRECRRRIHPESRALGPSLRFPDRIGRPVTQEELAEAAGISRVWYAIVESGRAPRVSSTVLGRIARALSLDADEHASLFRLAQPELSLPQVSSQSHAVLDAFASLRPVMRRLWSATTEVEALTIVCEDSVTRFDQPDAVLFSARAALGQWMLPVITSSTDGSRRIEAIHSECCSTLGPEQIDDLMSYGRIDEPGKVAVQRELPISQPIARRYRQALEQVGWQDLNVLFAHVRTRHGLLGQLSVLHSDGRHSSETDRAILSTLASLTSLALSNPT
jgi:transcriptional regulator with XRE-family HTH domain